MSTQKNSWKIKSQKVVYENQWITLRHHNVIHPDTSEGIYGVVAFKNIAVGVIPISEDGFTCLVGQYRFAPDEYSWEIPEGGCPFNEATDDAARRELAEETGIITEDLKCIVENISLSNSVTDEKGRIYIARNLTMAEMHPDPSEEIKLKKLPLTEAIEMALEGKIEDSLSIIGLMRVKLMMDAGEL